MLVNAQELEAKITFQSAKVSAARRILDAAYAAAEDSADADVVALLRYAADNVLGAESWMIDTTPYVVAPWHDVVDEQDPRDIMF